MSHSRGRAIVSSAASSRRSPGASLTRGNDTSRPAARARTTGDGPAGEVAHRGQDPDAGRAGRAVQPRQGLRARDVQAARRPHRDLAVDAAEVPPAAVAEAVVAGGAPVGQVVGGAQRRHPHGEGAAPGGQVDLEGQVAAHVASHAAPVHEHRGGVTRALEAGDPPRPPGQLQPAPVDTDVGLVALGLRAVPVVGQRHAAPAVVALQAEHPAPVERGATGLALADQGLPARRLGGLAGRVGRAARAGGQAHPGQRDGGREGSHSVYLVARAREEVAER